ncbi:MAG: STAS domain-containing protein [Deltaproteobacteria bacterium]|nr:STAS domain-containing protein [Deltaproteobacteria bacterium]
MTAAVQFSTTISDDVAIAMIGGRLDANNAQGVREKLAELADQAQSVVVDLSSLEWIDSSGVGALVSLYKRVLTAGGKVNVACLNGQPKEIFRLLRLDAALRAFPSVDEAVAHLRADS